MLGGNGECPTDNLLVQTVRLQLITEKTAYGPWQDMAKEANSAMKIPISFFIKALQTDFDDFRQSIPDELQQNGI